MQRLSGCPAPGFHGLRDICLRFTEFPLKGSVCSSLKFPKLFRPAGIDNIFHFPELLAADSVLRDGAGGQEHQRIRPLTCADGSVCL